MSSIEEYRQEQLEKLRRLESLGFNAYPSLSQRDVGLEEVCRDFDRLVGQSKWLVGRLMARREHGRVTFLDLADQSGRLQLIVRADALAEAEPQQGRLGYGELGLLARGDFLNARGVLKKSDRGEMSLEVSELRLLAKVLRPLPLELEDVGIRRRRRYLDMAINDEVRQRFLRRSLFWQKVRDFLNDRGFREVNVPVLEHTTGGAEATPFKTHMRALGEDFYLRISHELPLKRLLGGGLEKVYDLGPRFRNENYSDEHLPEHIALEWYWAYADWRDGMELMEEMFAWVARETFGRQKFQLGPETVDFGKRPWPRRDYAGLIAEHYDGLDVLKASLADVRRVLDKHGLEVEKSFSLASSVDKLFKHIRGDLRGPFWLINPPAFLEPLSKLDPTKPACVQRFQAIFGGSEQCKGFSELNDAREQLERWREQQARRDKGDEEAQMLDIDFIEMLEYGMPPACGLGLAERVFWVLEGVPAREGVPFNHLRREVDPNTRAIYPELFSQDKPDPGLL